MLLSPLPFFLLYACSFGRFTGKRWYDLSPPVRFRIGVGSPFSDSLTDESDWLSIEVEDCDPFFIGDLTGDLEGNAEFESDLTGEAVFAGDVFGVTYTDDFEAELLAACEPFTPEAEPF